jgi:hypothetical protein
MRSVAFLIGCALIVTGVGLVYPPAALVVAGAAIAAAALRLEVSG